MERQSNGDPRAAMDDNPRDRFQEHGRQVTSDAKALADDVRDMADEVTGFIQDQVERRPYVTLGAAVTVGYVLGGGVPRWLMRTAFAVGGRMLVGAVLNEVMGEGLDTLAGGSSGTEAP